MIGVAIVLVIMSMNMLRDIKWYITDFKNGKTLYEYFLETFVALSANSPGHTRDSITKALCFVQDFCDAQYVYCMPNPGGLLVALAYEDEAVS